MRKLYDHRCKECDKEFTSRKIGSKFCSRSCSATYRLKNLGPTEREQTNEALKSWWKAHPNKHKENGIRSQKGKRKIPNSLLEISKRTASKICRRLEIGCSICKWNKDICDIHHIVAKKDGGGDEHTNLTYLCPNCHRLASRGKLSIKGLITLEEQINDRWKSFYYG